MKLPKVVGVLRGDDPTRAIELARAAIRGGLRALEVTCTVPDAAGVIRALRLEGTGCSIGAGTVLSATQAREVIGAGTDFLVSPHFGADILEIARTGNVPYIPGALTPTEVAAVLSAGCEIVKIFPIARVGGVAYLRDLRGPFPQLQALVTGGVTSAEVSAYLQAGALSVGLGELFTGDLLDVETRTRALLDSL